MGLLRALNPLARNTAPRHRTARAVETLAAEARSARRSAKTANRIEVEEARAAMRANPTPENAARFIAATREPNR